MADINANPSPGFFTSLANVSFTFDDKGGQYAYSRDPNNPPSISKYISYDTLSPPNPFIAVTEDGRGRVVYDGGFPKFCNGNIPNWTNVATRPKTFSELIASHKFLYNALNWVANPAKTALGNRKVLIVGDKNDTDAGDGSDSYYVTYNEVNDVGFKAVFDTILAAAGYTPTYKNPKHYAGNVIDVRLAELEQYCCVIFMSSDHISTARITQSSINDFVTYRANGNGLIMITDHGDVINSISHALGASSGFFKTANAIITRFGAYFSGSYDRTPVNVGFLRSTYGDHPLYNGMTNAEYISAMNSESRVVVTVTPTAPSSGTLTLPINQGTNTIDILIVKSNGSVVIQRFTYVLQGEEIIFVKSKDSRPGGNGQVVENGNVFADNNGNLFLESIRLNVGDLGTLVGDIQHNGKRIGTVIGTSAGTDVSFLTSAGRKHFRNGDTLAVKVLSPLTYEKVLNVVGNTLARHSRLDTQLSAIRKFQNDNANIKSGLMGAFAAMNPDAVNNKASFQVSSLINAVVGEAGDSSPLFQGTFTCEILADQATLIARASALGTGFKGLLIDAATGNIWAYNTNGILAGLAVITGVKVKDVFSVPCKLTNGQKTWSVSAAGVIT